MTNASGSSSMSMPLRSTQRTSSWLLSPVWLTMRLMSESVSGKSGSLQQLPQPVQRNFRYFSPVATSPAVYQRLGRGSRASLAGRRAAEVGSRVTQILGPACKVVQVKLLEALAVHAVRAQAEAPGAHTPTYIEQRVRGEHHAPLRVRGAQGVGR